MQPLFIIAVAAGTAYLVHLLRTAKSANSLRYHLQRIQIYRFKLSEPIVFRVWIEFVNLENAPINVNQLYLDIYLNISGSKHRIGTLNAANISIPSNQTIEKSFDISVPWKNLGVGLLSILTNFATTRQWNFPDKAIVEGQLKASGLSIPINVEVPFNSTPIEN